MATITPGSAPIPYTYGGHTYWLMPSGAWANNRDGSGSVPQSAIVAILAGQGVQQDGQGNSGQGSPSTGSGGGTGGTAGGSGPGGTQVTGVGINYQQPTADPYGFGDRFGPANLQPYGYQIYAPIGTPGTPAAGGSTGTGGTSSGSTGTGGTGTGTVGTGGTGTGGTGTGSTGSSGSSGSGSSGSGSSGSGSSGSGSSGSGSGSGSGTGAGGVGGQHGGNDRGGFGGSGGSSGSGGNDRGGLLGLGGSGGTAGAGNGGSGGLSAGSGSPGNGYLNLGPIGAGLLSAASWAAPFPYSAPFTLAQLAGRAYNTSETDSNRAALGIPGLSVGQALGSLLGLNNYGSLAGNQTIANREQGAANPFGGGGTSPVTTGGIYHDAYGPFDAFGTGEDTLAYTPSELSARRSAAAGYDMGTPITRGDGTVIGYMRPDGTATTAAAQASLNDASAYGNRGAATTAAMGGGWNGSQSAPGSRIGSGTGLTGGGQGERAGFRFGGFVAGTPDRIPDNRTIRADEGEFVVRRAAARKLGPELLGLVNDPRQAPRVRQALLGLSGRR